MLIAATKSARPRLAVGALAALALVAAGCGSSKSTTSSASAPAPTAPAAASTRSAPAGGGATTVTTKSNKLGAILAAGAKQRTVYLFEADTGSTSRCSGACAAVWPPVTTAAAATAKGSARSSELSVSSRPDGTKQVTYHGHPLYFYARDGDRSDAYGQGLKSFGAAWYVLAPSGKKIDTT